MTYKLPCDAPVSASWQDHKNRNPPSGEPGTDYACAYGTDLAFAGAGVVSVIDTSPDGAEGRRLSIDLDDGRRVSYIHLSAIFAYLGQRVDRGQTGVIWSGASGNGSDWYYGPHVHVSLWERPGMSYSQTIDFGELAGPDDPQPEPEGTEMTYSIIPDAWTPDIYVMSHTTGIRTRIASPADVSLLVRARDNNGGDHMAWPELDTVRSYLATINPAASGPPNQPAPADAHSHSPLVAPAWVGASGLIVLVIIGIVDLVTRLAPG
jgi:murein DD-endopeptidase MepM/ murein hydrolase activator NlpD